MNKKMMKMIKMAEKKKITNSFVTSKIDQA